MGWTATKKECITLRVNGTPYDVVVAPNDTLATVLRERLELTGTKEACRVGECGSCTVLLDGRPALSCCTLAISARNKEILTIEGLAEGTQLHPIQRAFIDHGAIQCGFCTPGMILMTKALLDENPQPTPEEIKEWLGGNLCRCTGYAKITEAVTGAAESMGRGGH
jgi:carbon-monoxide dehydrogenase small subunit